MPRVVFVVPTNKLGQELEEKLRRLAPLYMSSSAAEAFEVELVQAPKRTPQNCQRFESITQAHRVHHKAAQQLCKACPHREQCPFLREVKQPRGHITILTPELAYSYLPGRHIDLLVLDEGIMDVMYPTVSLELHHLAKLKEQKCFEVDDHAWAKITDFMTCGHSVSSLELAEALSPDVISFRSDSYIHALIQQAAHAPLEEQLDILSQAPQLEALRLLAQHAKNGWSGASIQRGKLCLTQHRPLPLEHAHTVLYLDATTSPLHAHAVLGPEHQMVRIPVLLPEHVTIEQVHWSWSKNVVRYGQIRHDISARRIQALIHRYDSPSTAWVLHKSHRECDELASYFSQAEQEQRVIHYGMTRGSNDYESFDTIVIVARHLPEAAIEARAELLQSLTGADWLECWDEAVYVMEQGEMVQAAHRIRPTRSQSPVRIVIVDDRPPLPGLPVTVDHSIDVMVMDELQEVRGHDCYEALVWRHLEQHQLLIPSVLQACDKQGGRFPKKLMGNLPPCLSQEVVNLWTHARTFTEHVHNYWKSNWKNFADTLHLMCTSVATSQGGQPLTVLHWRETELTEELLTPWMSALGVQWYEFKGRKVWVIDHRHELLSLALLADRKSDVNYAGLAELEGVSTRTIRRRMKRAQLTEEDLQQHWEEHRNQEPSKELHRSVEVMHGAHEKSVIPRHTINREHFWSAGPAPPG